MSNAFQNNSVPPPQSGFSPLDDMVQRFRQTFGPRPAPAPPPNLEQQNDGGEPKPPIQDRQAFNWANSALPPGSRQPPAARFQPFMPASLPREPHQWGQEEQFPDLPQSFEAPGLAQNLSQWFGQNGSNSIAEMAMKMGPNAADFLKGVQQGRQQAATMAREQLALHITEMKERQEEEMTRYSEVMSAHGALNDTTDPAKMVKPVKGKTLMEDLYDTAREIGDVGRSGTLGDLIASGAKPSQIVAFLQSRDNRLRDLQKLKSTVDQDTAEETAWGLTPKQTPAQSDVSSYSGLREPGATETAAAPAPASTDPTAPAPAPAPRDKVAGPGAPPDQTTQDDTPKSSPLDAVVTEGIKGNEPTAEFAKNFPKQYHAAMLQIAQKNAAIRDLIKNPPADRSQILPRLRQIDPEVASDLQQVLAYQMPASGGVSGTGASPGTRSGQYSDKLRDLATSVDPKWNQGFYQDQQRFRTDVGTQTALLRTKDLASMADRLNTDLRIIEADLKKRGLSTTDVNMDGIIRQFANDPKYIGMQKDFLAYNDAYNTIVSGGRHTMGGTREQVEGIGAYAPLATYRNIIKGHMQSVWGIIEGAQDRWQSIGGKADNMPSGDTPNAQAAFRTIQNFRDMDYVSGARPFDPGNSDNDIVIKKAGPWGPAGRYYWTGKDQINRDSPKNWTEVK